MIAEPVAVLDGITRRYGEGPSAVLAVDGIDLEIRSGEFVAIVGESGSGKSTLLQILGCLDRADAGTYTLGGQDVSSLGDLELARVRNEQIGFVFQSFHLLEDRSALENVALPLQYRRRGAAPAGDPARMLERVGLADRSAHRPSQLSGGERQRVAIARALVKRPPLLLCDEPTGNLDTRTGEQIKQLIWRISRDSGTTVVLVTHNAELADEAERTVRIKDGIVEK
jgi:putative ABC transport system ATP-binding protein